MLHLSSHFMLRKLCQAEAASIRSWANCRNCLIVRCLSLSLSFPQSRYHVFRAFPQSDDKSACVSSEISSQLMIPLVIYQTRLHSLNDLRLSLTLSLSPSSLVTSRLDSQPPGLLTSLITRPSSTLPPSWPPVSNLSFRFSLTTFQGWVRGIFSKYLIYFLSWI